MEYRILCEGFIGINKKPRWNNFQRGFSTWIRVISETNFLLFIFYIDSSQVVLNGLFGTSRNTIFFFTVVHDEDNGIPFFILYPSATAVFMKIATVIRSVEVNVFFGYS